MMHEKNYVAFDCGNSSIRVMSGLYDGNSIELKKVHQVPNEPVSVNGIFYWDILYIFKELQAGLLKAFLKYGPVESVGISTWGIDFGLIGKSHQLLGNPLSYRNTLGEIILKDLSDEAKHKTFMATGIPDHPMNSVYQLLGIKNICLNITRRQRCSSLFPICLPGFLQGRSVVNQLLQARPR